MTNAIQVETTGAGQTYPLLLKQLLNTAPIGALDREIVYRDLARHDYRTLRQRIVRLAAALGELGVRPGDTVAVMDWDSHRYLECFFAIPMMGAVLQTVNVRLSPEQILYTLNHAGADVLLVNAEFGPLLSAIKDKLETVRKFVLLRDGDVAPEGPFNREYEAMLAASTPAYAFPDFDENTRATTYYTTGTTGAPKGVYFTHRQLVLHTLAVLTAFGCAGRQGRLHNDDVYMPITPMFHAHAWGFPYAATLLGLKQVYPGRYAPDTLLTLIKQERVTFSHCVPTILQMLLSSPIVDSVDLGAWKVVIGGAALSTALAKSALARGIDVFSGYGMSETCPVLTAAHLQTPMLDSPMEQQSATRARTGLPLPLVDLRIVDNSMNDVPHDGRAVGEIVVRAPWLTAGYWNNPEASRQLWAGGYLHTGDIGNIDAAGYLQVTDRIKDVIKSGGEWISSLQIEELIARHDAVNEVAVIGLKDARWGERPLALVVPKPAFAGKVGPEQITAHVRAFADRGMISRYAVPERVLFVDALERTSVGKLDKKALRERYQVACARPTLRTVRG
jgi:acyl-CoA synthetase (AMP-forming)/AMP-acid ligase II